MLLHRWAGIGVLCSADFFQACFALTSAQVFSCTDLITDLEHFYNSIMELLNDMEEKGEVDQLMAWWNQWVIYVMIVILLTKTTARYFLCTLMSNTFHLRAVHFLGFVWSVWSTMKGMMFLAAGLTDGMMGFLMHLYSFSRYFYSAAMLFVTLSPLLWLRGWSWMGHSTFNLFYGWTIIAINCPYLGKVTKMTRDAIMMVHIYSLSQ